MFDISADFRKLERALSDAAQKQLPFATALTLNDVAKDIKLAEERQVQRTLDRPTPYTQRAMYIRRASKSTLTAEVGVKDRQADYLKFQVRGGVRRPKGRALVIGAGLKRNQYGNLPRGAVKRVVAKKNTFVAGRKGRGGHLAPGIYQRTGGRGAKGGLKLLVAFKGRAQYSKRFPFHQTAERTARGAIQGHWGRRLKQAMATAR